MEAPEEEERHPAPSGGEEGGTGGVVGGEPRQSLGWTPWNVGHVRKAKGEVLVATRNFARKWFGPYVVTSANDNGTYHLAELDGTRMTIPVAGKRVKAFKKRHECELDLGILDDDGRSEADVESEEEE